MPLAFDLDGCVVDNKFATYRAYLRAGVKSHQFPEDWFHVSGWATEEQRKAKSVIYRMLLPVHGRILVAGKILLQTGGHLLSGCSENSALAFLEQWPEFRRTDIHFHWAQTLDMKIERLNRLPPGHYFDDWDVAVSAVRGRTEWNPIDVSRF